MSEIPPEVTEAAARLRERPIVVAAPMPEVFKAIIDNDNKRSELLNMRGAMTTEQWRKLGELTQYKKNSLRPSAEKALAWNRDKGQGPKREQD